MAGPTTLSELLRENLREVAPPEGYQELSGRLAAIQPTRSPPTVKVSPENVRQPRGAGAEEA
jgi:hypothetical protein